MTTGSLSTGSRFPPAAQQDYAGAAFAVEGSDKISIVDARGQGADPFHASYVSVVPGPDTPAYEFNEVQWAGPSAVMLQALQLVQHDLDAVGLEHIRLSFAVAGGSDEYPIVNVQWRGTWTSDSIDLDAKDLAWVTADVAAQMAQGLIELEGIYMPTCPDHNKRASAGVSIRGSAVWACHKQGVTPHLLAAVGELDLIRTPGHRIAPLWRNLADLGPP